MRHVNVMLETDSMASLPDTRLYFVCGCRPGGRPLRAVLEPALAGGVDVFQLREKDGADEDVLRHAEIARELCGAAGATFILNDRPDLVEAAGADGVHVGQDDTPVPEARELVGDRIVGLSTHSEEQADAAAGVDYFAVGPVHATPTKRGRPAIGLAPVRHAASTATAPWFAIGGIDATTIGAVLDAGAQRVVVVRAIAEASEPERAARELREALDGAT
jgi:thiamine-phosphate pyrophosphorylase